MECVDQTVQERDVTRDKDGYRTWQLVRAFGVSIGIASANWKLKMASAVDLIEQGYTVDEVCRIVKLKGMHSKAAMETMHDAITRRLHIRGGPRLVAAAPALLDACKQAIRRIEWLNTGGPDMPDPTLDKLCAAIKAAEG